MLFLTTRLGIEEKTRIYAKFVETNNVGGLKRHHGEHSVSKNLGEENKI